MKVVTVLEDGEVVAKRVLVIDEDLQGYLRELAVAWGADLLPCGGGEDMRVRVEVETFDQDGRTLAICLREPPLVWKIRVRRR